MKIFSDNRCPSKETQRLPTTTKPTDRNRGSSLITVVVIASLIVSILGLSITQLMQAVFNGLNSSNIAIQAQQYAASKAELVRLYKYDELTDQQITAVPDTDFQDEVLLSAETTTEEDIKQRTATINVYKSGDTRPRASIKVLCSNVNKESSGVPIGTIIAWASKTMPTDGGIWLVCNGQSTAAYPKLKAIVGNNVPNYQGVFLRGYGSQTSTHYGTVTHSSAGLGELQGDAIRNVTGSFPMGVDSWTGYEGVFYQGNHANHLVGDDDGYKSYSTYIDLSRGTPTANENRPINKAVYWLIKAA